MRVIAWLIGMLTLANLLGLRDECDCDIEEFNEWINR